MDTWRIIFLNWPLIIIFTWDARRLEEAAYGFIAAAAAAVWLIELCAGWWGCEYIEAEAE